MKAADVMTRRVISIKPDSSIIEAAQLLLQNRISGLPVLDQAGKLVGIVTEGAERVESRLLGRRELTALASDFAAGLRVHFMNEVFRS